MLKISGSTESLTQPEKGVIGVEGDNRARRDGNKLNRSEIDNGKVVGSEVDNEVEKKGQKTSKSKKLSKSKKTVESDFFTPGARLALTKLRQAFLKAPIFHHFDLERHIRNEIDASGYAIGRVLSQLISDNLGRWHLVAFFFQKMILAETRYETHNSELLAIIEAFKTWRHYLKRS